MRFLVALTLSVLLACAGAQQRLTQRLTVNGTFVEVRTDLVSGSAYAPAEPYAEALGAVYRYDARTGVLLSFGGRFLSLQGFPSAKQAAVATTALTVDGQQLPSTGAVRTDAAVYLPVKSVTAALGGRTAYLAEAKTVAVVFPRPTLRAVSPPQAWGSFERFVLTFDAPVDLKDDFVPSLGAARFRFLRAEAPAELSGRPFNLSGGRISDAAFVPSGSFLDFNLILQQGNTYRTFSEPYGAGERVVIDVFRDVAGTGESVAASNAVNTAASTAAGAQTPVLVLRADAGTFPLAERLKEVLGSYRFQVELQRATPENAAQAGFSVPFLLTLRQASLPAGRFNVYYLPPDAPMLSAPVRRAAAEVTLSDKARAQLARLKPDTSLGERLARGLATGLGGRTSLKLASLMAAPLEALSGAAGRGVMLELSPEDLGRPGASAELAGSLAPLLRTLLQGR